MTEKGRGSTRDGEGGSISYRISRWKGLEAREVSACPQNPKEARGLREVT